MQHTKISQVHSCIWKLEFMHIFYHNHPKIIKLVLNFPEFISVCKKSAQFIHSFIHSSCDQCATTIFGHTHSNIFLSALNFWYQHVKKFSWLCSRYIRTFSSSLLCAIIARNHLLFFKIFSNFVHFCPVFQIFCLLYHF